MAATPVLASLLARLTAVLERNAQASTPARALKAQLAGRSFAVVLDGPGLRVRLGIADSALAVTADDLPADAEVRGTPLALLGALRTETAGASSGVAISGDPEIAQAFQKLLRHARPDLEAELARRIGEAPAEFAARAFHGALGFAERLRTTLRASVAEYLTEESRDLPARGEADAYALDVDRVRDGVERAEARLALLEARVRAGQA